MKKTWHAFFIFLLAFGAFCACDYVPNLTMEDAVSSGNEPIVKYYLSHKADPNKKDLKGNPVILLAAQQGSLSIAKRLIKAGADVNALGENGRTALMLASENGHDDIAKLLLEKGANVNTQDEQDQTALMYATQKGHLGTAKVLARSTGVKLDAQNKEGLTPLMIAAIDGKTALAEFLILKGADVNARDNNDLTPLMYAAMNAKAAVAEELIYSGANVNMKDKNGFTALMYAITLGEKADHIKDMEDLKTISDKLSEGAPAVVKMLLAKNADLKATSQYAPTLFFWGLNKNDLKLSKLILEKSTEINAKEGKMEVTALALAIIFGQSKNVRLLLDNGADPNTTFQYNKKSLFATISEVNPAFPEEKAKDKLSVVALATAEPFELPEEEEVEDKQVPALVYSILSGQTDISNALIEKGADITKKNKEGDTILMLASKEGQVPVVKMLIQKGADVNDKNDLGMTALMWASIESSSGVTKALVENGAELDATDNAGWTALMYASKGDFDSARELIDNGADVNIKNNDNDTALMWAKWLENASIVGLLEQAGAKE